MGDYKLKDGENVIGVQEHKDGSQTVTVVGKDGVPVEHKVGKATKEKLEAGDVEVGSFDQDYATDLPVPETKAQKAEREKAEKKEAEAAQKMAKEHSVEPRE